MPKKDVQYGICGVYCVACFVADNYRRVKEVGLERARASAEESGKSRMID